MMESSSSDNLRRSSTSSPSISPPTTSPRLRPVHSPSPNTNIATLSPPATPLPHNKANAHKPSSNPDTRLSTRSNAPHALTRSRPQSLVYPMYQSSLPYALVRDFAYATYLPLHYGTPPEPPSGATTPASEAPRRLSDPYPSSLSGSRGPWSPSPEGDDSFFGEPFYGETLRPPGSAYQQLPATAYGDGPPWYEDEDLHSPIVTSAKHRKSKSTATDFDFKSHESATAGRKVSYADTAMDGNSPYYLRESSGTVRGSDGEYIVYPLEHTGDQSWRNDTRSEGTITDRLQFLGETDFNHAYGHSSDEDVNDNDESRYSRDYQFTIASPDEEMHGKAVALFDFARENENELPLIEGQVLWVSYRHGQGWLVAQDPKSGESGLVPEEYVRLVRHIEGGLTGLNGQAGSSSAESPTTTELDTPTTSPQHERAGSGTSQHYIPVVSHFSTSSKDLHPYPPHLLGSQASTPTVMSEGKFPRRGSQDAHILHDPLAEEDDEEDMVICKCRSEDVAHSHRRPE